MYLVQETSAHLHLYLGILHVTSTVGTLSSLSSLEISIDITLVVFCLFKRIVMIIEKLLRKQSKLCQQLTFKSLNKIPQSASNRLFTVLM